MALKHKPPAKPGNQNAFRFRLGKFTVSNTKSLVLEDAHTKPAVTHRIDNFSFNLDKLDSSRPEQASALSMQFKYGAKVAIKIDQGKLDSDAKLTLNKF